MKAKLSPLKVVDFLVINSRLKFIAPSKESLIRELLREYEIEIDFGKIHDSDNHHVFVKVSINEDSPPKHNGYSIFAEVVGAFSLNSVCKKTPIF